MSDAPAEYHYHELEKLFGDYKPTASMPCFRCDEPEASEIRFAFAKFAAAAHDRLPSGTMPKMDALFALEPKPEAESADQPSLDPGPDEGLFMLRDYVIAEDKIMAAAIKAAGGLRVLARELDVHPAVIEEWKRIPVARLPAIARITGLPQHVLRPDLFDVGAPQSYYGTKEEEDESWRWNYAQQLWLPLPYPPGFLPARCCARRVRLKLVAGIIGQ